MPIYYPTIYKRVKDLLSDLTNIPDDEIFADMGLSPDPLGFTPQGLRALAPKLNTAFSDYSLNLESSDTSSLKTVRSIARLVFSRIS